jgi:transposase InsO family protein
MLGMYLHALLFIAFSIRACLNRLKFLLFGRTAPAAFKRRRRSARTDPKPEQGSNSRKPEWVRQIVMGLAAHGLSCRRIKDDFNRQHGNRITIGKTWASEVMKSCAAQIQAIRRGAHNVVPPPMEPNKVWALDMSCWRTADGRTQMILGILDHGSRALMRLRVIPRKCAWTLLGHLCLAIAAHGRPAALRADNEGMFKSRLWNLALSLMNIRHQRIKVKRPWQNGRIERLFGTLKPLLRKLQPANVVELRQALAEFNWFYDHVRVHLHLDGRTPMEVRHGDTPERVRARAGNGRWISAMKGLLIGYHLRR